MPRIPTYKEQQRFKNVNAHNSNRFDVPPAASDLGSAKIIVDNGQARQNTLASLSGLGQNLQKWGNNISDWEVQSQLTSAIDNFTSLKQDPEFQDKLYGENGLFNQKGEASLNLPEQFKLVAQEYGQKYAEKVKGELGTSYFNGQLENYISNYGEKATAQSSKEYTDWQLQTYFKASSFALEEAINNFADPKLFKNATAEAMFNTRLAGKFSGLSEENINTNVQDIASKSYLGIANKLLENGNTNEASKILGSNMLNEADAYTLTNILQTQSKKELSLSRQVEYVTKTTNNLKLKTLAENLNTNLLQASTTGDTSNILALSKQYKDLGDEKNSKELEKKVKFIDDNYELIIGMNEQKLPERIQTLSALEHELNNSKLKKNSKNYQSLVQKKDLVALNIKNYNNLLKNDPAKATKVEIQGTLYEIAKQRVDGQEDNGLSMQQIKVLTRDEAADMANLWEDADLDGRVGIMENLKGYGLYAPKVAAELGLDFVEQLAIRHLNENSRYLPSLKRIISANSVKTKDLPIVENIDVLGAEVSTNSKVFQTYSNMAAANAENKLLPQNLKQLQKSITNILQQNNGNVDRTVKLIDGELDSLNNSKMNILFYPLKIDKDVLEQGLNDFLGQDLEQFLAASPFENQINMGEYLQHIREKAIWQNDFENNQYVLLDTKTNQPVKNAQGQNFRKSDADLLRLS